ncbi:MAG: hypothetical protein KDC16_06510, partial [Saprospiraceae bacterium]|nr:hypothetical protein [Saprospiraceae bacterium]
MLARHFAILIVLIPLNLFGQSITIPHISYTTDDGLPSSEVYDVLQDRDGYMWFSTDNGLSRFDGYEFKNYGFEEGLTDLVVFDLQEDSKGRIWMNSLTGKMFYYDKNLDNIQLYEYQNLIDSFYKQNMLIYNIDSVNTITFETSRFRNSNIISINSQGTISNLSEEIKRSFVESTKMPILNEIYLFLRNSNIIALYNIPQSDTL